MIQERLFQPDWRGNILNNPMRVEDGFLPLPQGAGWGVELNEELVKAHPRIEAGTPSLFRLDNSICDW